MAVELHAKKEEDSTAQIIVNQTLQLKALDYEGVVIIENFPTTLRVKIPRNSVYCKPYNIESEEEILVNIPKWPGGIIYTKTVTGEEVNISTGPILGQTDELHKVMELCSELYFEPTNTLNTAKPLPDPHTCMLIEKIPPATRKLFPNWETLAQYVKFKEIL